MTTVFWIQRDDFTTTFVDTQDRLRYIIEWSTSEGRWSSSVRTVAQQRAYTGDSPDFWYDEIANIVWRPEATYITLGTNMVSASSYLRREKPFSRYVVFTLDITADVFTTLGQVLVSSKHRETKFSAGMSRAEVL